jgi:methyl-accepting chemotaxis protein
MVSKWKLSAQIAFSFTFAVVAEEVRSLALRAKEAAHKTEGLIRESMKQTEEGESTSRSVAGRLGEIVAGVGKVSDLVSEIAAAAKSQTGGLEQVNRSMAEMDEVTQQNAASAVQSSASAIQLSGQAEELAAMVGAFRLEDGSGPPAEHRRLEIPGAKPGRARITDGGAVHHA